MAKVKGRTNTRKRSVHFLTVGRLPIGRKVIDPALPRICQSSARATLSNRSDTIGLITARPREFFPLPVIIRIRPSSGRFSINRSSVRLAPARSKSCKSNVRVPLSERMCVDVRQGL